MTTINIENYIKGTQKIPDNEVDSLTFMCSQSNFEVRNITFSGNFKNVIFSTNVTLFDNIVFESPVLETLTANGLTTITATNTEVELLMLSECPVLTTVNLPELTTVTGVTSMLSECPLLTTVTLPELTTVTGVASMLSNCKNLSTVSLPELTTMTEIETMLRSCHMLTNVSLPKLTTMTDSGSILNNCSKLTNVSLPELTTITVTDTDTTRCLMLVECSALSTVDLPELTTVTGVQIMLNSCPILTTVSLPKLKNMTGIIEILVNCSVLSTVDLPELTTMTKIETMLTSCPMLTNVSLPKLTTMTDCGTILVDCSALTNVSLPELTTMTKVQTILAECENLTTVSLPELTTMTEIETMLIGCPVLTIVSLPELTTMTRIPQILVGCVLTIVSLPELTTMTEVGYMLVDCPMLTTVNLPELTTMKDVEYLLVDCPVLTTVNLPELTTMTNVADILCNCGSLVYVEFPKLKGISCKKGGFLSYTSSTLKYYDKQSQKWVETITNPVSYLFIFPILTEISIMDKGFRYHNVHVCAPSLHTITGSIHQVSELYAPLLTLITPENRPYNGCIGTMDTPGSGVWYDTARVVENTSFSYSLQTGIVMTYELDNGYEWLKPKTTTVTYNRGLYNPNEFKAIKSPKPEIAALSGDPYLFPVVGPVIKLPDIYGIYRVLQHKETKTCVNVIVEERRDLDVSMAPDGGSHQTPIKSGFFLSRLLIHGENNQIIDIDLMAAFDDLSVWMSGNCDELSNLVQEIGKPIIDGAYTARWIDMGVLGFVQVRQYVNPQIQTGLIWVLGKNTSGLIHRNYRPKLFQLATVNDTSWCRLPTTGRLTCQKSIVKPGEVRDSVLHPHIHNKLYCQ